MSSADKVGQRILRSMGAHLKIGNYASVVLLGAELIKHATLCLTAATEQELENQKDGG
jgi:hypothetical protein